MSGADRKQPLTVDQISTLSPQLARLYVERTHKALRRDLNQLKSLELVVADGSGRYRANVEIIVAFLPARRTTAMPQPTVRQG
jgi:hypothetical protein